MRRQTIRKALSIIIVILLLADFGYSFMQYHNSRLDGDLPNSINPSPDIQNVFDSPLGLDVVLKGEKYANPNRFFCQWWVDQYMTHAPVALQAIFKPIESVYVAIGIVKLIFHILLLYFLLILLTGKTRVFRFKHLFMALLLTTLFQANGFQEHMGIVHKSITYFFFYTVPVALLLLYFMPFIMRTFYDQKSWDRNFIRILWLFLAVVVSLSGALIPGISIIASFLFVLHFFTSHYDKGGNQHFFQKLFSTVKRMPSQYYFYLIPVVLLSFYSLFVGMANTNTIAQAKPVSELYVRLSQGIFKQFIAQPGFAVILGLLLINYLLVYFRYKNQGGKQVIQVFSWLSLFIIIYIILLPLGGYRDYRPLIIRGDTILPVTLALLFMLGYSTQFILDRISASKKYFYIPLLIAIAGYFTLNDNPLFEKNDCERKGLEQISQSNGGTVALDLPCSVFAWQRFKHTQPSVSKIKVLKKWNIVNEDVELKYLHVNQKDKNNK